MLLMLGVTRLTQMKTFLTPAFAHLRLSPLPMPACSMCRADYPTLAEIQQAHVDLVRMWKLN